VKRNSWFSNELGGHIQPLNMDDQDGGTDA